MLAPETIRAYQHQRAVAMIARSIVGAPRQWTEEEQDDTLEQRYYQIWQDEPIATKDDPATLVGNVQ